MFKKYLFTFIKNNYSEFYFNFLIRNYDEFNKKFISHKQEYLNYDFYSPLVVIPKLKFLMFDWILDSEIGFLQDGKIEFSEFKWIDGNFYTIPISYNGIYFNWSHFLDYCLQFEEIKNLQLKQKLKESELKFSNLKNKIEKQIIKSEQDKILLEFDRLQKEQNELLKQQNYNF